MLTYWWHHSIWDLKDFIRELLDQIKASKIKHLAGQNIIMKTLVTFLYIINSHCDKEMIQTIVVLNKYLRKKTIQGTEIHHTANFKMLEK